MYFCSDSACNDFYHSNIIMGFIYNSRDGKKYILRTDVMYRNSDQNMSEKVAKAMQLLQQAETLEVICKNSN